MFGHSDIGLACLPSWKNTANSQNHHNFAESCFAKTQFAETCFAEIRFAETHFAEIATIFSYHFAET
jgi:hypothetical protein